MKKKEGKINTFVSVMIVLTASIVIAFRITMNRIDYTRDWVEDSLVLANLAGATIDLQEYGSTNNIVNRDIDKSFDDYIFSLKQNLNLDDSMNPKNSDFIKSKVIVKDFIIYSVIGNDIIQVRKDSLGNSHSTKYIGEVGKMKTPDGYVINNTTVYSKIGFTIKGMLEQSFDVEKEGSVDITDKDV